MHDSQPGASGVRHLDPGSGLTEAIVTLADGRRLRAVTAGDADGPLVVFEAGMSSPAASWIHIQREVSRRARTVSYDRAGYGASDADPQDRTLERIADDLAGLLDGLGEAGPVILVGHSWGGPIVRLFADRHPGRIAGLVLLDGTVAEISSERIVRLTARMLAVTALLARVGGRRLRRKLNMPSGVSPDVSAADLQIMLRDFASTAAMRTGAREAAQVLAALPALRKLQAVGTPDVPTICLQAGRVETGMAKLRPLWNQTAAELMAAVPRGRMQIVEDSGHLIPVHAPAAVQAAVLEVLDAVVTEH